MSAAYYSQAEAEMDAARLRESDHEWTYLVKGDIGGGMWRIEVYDETGAFISCW